MDVRAAFLLLLTAPLPACEARKQAPVDAEKVTALREPEILLRALFHRLGVRSLSECEEYVSHFAVHGLSEEERAARIEHYGKTIDAREHADFRATVAAGRGVLPGFDDLPLVLDGNLDRHDSDRTDGDGGARLTVDIVATAPDHALVDVFWIRGSIHPAERCFTAEFRDGTWSVEQGYASFCEAFAPWQAAR